MSRLRLKDTSGIVGLAMNVSDTLSAPPARQDQLRFCLGLSKNWGVPQTEQLSLLAETGWNGYFPCWRPGDDLEELARHGSSLGLELQSVHAPWGRAADLWGEEAEKGAAAIAELSECLRATAAAGAPVMVMHAWIGFLPVRPTQAGLSRFAEVVDLATRLGVKIAVENTEGEEHLDAMLRAFPDNPYVGFCWDTGHELCYNRCRDLMAEYGGRLLGTHINDNLGVSDPTGPTTWHDDLHLLPFDGIADWPGIAARLRRSGFSGPLTFELSRTSKPDRHENDAYASTPLREYLLEARERASRVAALL